MRKLMNAKQFLSLFLALLMITSIISPVVFAGNNDSAESDPSSGNASGGIYK